MGGLFGHKEHLVRVAALFAAGVLVFVALQSLLVPKGFGGYGHYRAGALDDNRARPLVHAGRGACVECHADVWRVLATRPARRRRAARPATARSRRMPRILGGRRR